MKLVLVCSEPPQKQPKSEAKKQPAPSLDEAAQIS